MTSYRASVLPTTVDRASPPPVRAAAAVPIVLTGTMGAADQRYFDELRRLHFPAHRNVLQAHLTLFHHLPPSALPELQQVMRGLAAEEAPPKAEIIGVMPMGRGTAFRVRSPALSDMREHIAEHFQRLLTPQDRGTPILHITVQNKVTPAQAKQLQQQLLAGFQQRPLEIKGLAAHHYLDGPWQQAFAVSFRGRR